MATDDPVYLDYNASTPCDSRVVEAMGPYLAEVFANPASRSHRAGQRAFAALEETRARVATALGARSATEIVFTSGATEGNNLAVAGAARAAEARGRHLVTQATEHAAVLEPLRALEREGWELTVLGVDREGRIRLDDLEAALRTDTTLVSLMLANNETGTLQPVAEAAAVIREAGALLHCDAAQGPGKVVMDVNALGVDLLTVSAHKVYGPKGSGALYRRRRHPALRLPPQLYGGGQEEGVRSGTPNLPGAVGLATALELAAGDLEAEATRLSGLRDRLEGRILSALDGCIVNGCSDSRLPQTSNISFSGVDGSALLASLSDLAVSSGSACTSSTPEPSVVLRAMGVSRRLAAASIRFSLGRPTTVDEVDLAADRVISEVTRLRSMA
jgi:cysteine desulfurase